MSNYEEEVKRLQAEAKANLQKELAEVVASDDIMRNKRRQLASELGYIRFKQKMSQAELAKKTDIPQPRISRIESGSANPSLNTLLKIAEALNADIMIEYRGKL